MIDLHCHMLPAVDDGAQTLVTSLRMAKEAENEGINKILLTPHYMDGEYTNHKDEIMLAVNNLQKTFYDNNINIELRAGQEVHINGDLLDEIDRGDVLYADGQSKKYIMLELPHHGVPEYTQNIVFEMMIRGITPIIVHPERNLGFQNNPDILYELVEQGCLTQITATSYVGGFGKNIQRFTEDIIESGLGFMFSSDAHNLSGRRFMMQEAFQKLSSNLGEDIAKKYKNNANAVWNGENIKIERFKRINKKRKISKFLKNLLRNKKR
ncbi:MAG: tyrosine protein phosphatase [Staphylococcus epidermidis]|nr:tyrosine protein phosphatase [Staphylococcus epidermidis]